MEADSGQNEEVVKNSSHQMNSNQADSSTGSPHIIIHVYLSCQNLVIDINTYDRAVIVILSEGITAHCSASCTRDGIETPSGTTVRYLNI
ncbi:hypothetical protein KIN20_002737 [Parelaphostrongylus tenuis]|uniref:Uncharacterized protein n=1 Tax=Parelaphostrongylus tenuis TaxID=148309 RepID=A0AAD5MH38_PARTN|nr:hypothetical protein KIN20_002737 [Parelaphostrongylus tenuis]